MSDDNFKDPNNPDLAIDNTTPGEWRKTVRVKTAAGDGQQTEKWVDKLRKQWEAEEEARKNGGNQH